MNIAEEGKSVKTQWIGPIGASSHANNNFAVRLGWRTGSRRASEEGNHDEEMSNGASNAQITAVSLWTQEATEVKSLV